MFNKLKNVLDKIRNLNNLLDEYKKDTIIQSLPSVAYVNRAKKLIEQKKYKEAEELLFKALQLPQKDALVYKYLGTVYEKSGDFEKACENLQISADLAPHDKTVWRQLGLALIATDRYENAEKAFENADKISPNNTDTYTGWGMALMKQKKYSEAREKFAKASQINKFNFSALFLCAVMEARLGMHDKAEIKLAFLSNVCPNEKNTYEYAMLKAIKKDYDTAIIYALKAIDHNSKMIQPYMLLGEIYSEKYDEENALKYFNLGNDIFGFSAGLYFEWGDALIRFGRYDEAKEKLIKAYEAKYPEAEYLLTLCCVLKDEFEECAQCLQNEPDSDNIAIKQAAGIWAYKHNDYENARRFLRMNPENALNCYYLAKSYVNNDEKIREYYEEALKIYPKYLQAYIDYSQYLISKDDYKEAQRKLRKALKHYGNNVDLLNLMFYSSYILAKEKVCEYNVKETLAIAQKIEEINPDLFKYYEQKNELTGLL